MFHINSPVGGIRTDGPVLTGKPITRYLTRLRKIVSNSPSVGRRGRDLGSRHNQDCRRRSSRAMTAVLWRLRRVVPASLRPDRKLSSRFNKSTRRANRFCLSESRVKPLAKKYFCFTEMKIRIYLSASRPTQGGVAQRTGAGRGCGGRGWRADEGA
jgi:hypothetical protein